MLAQQPCVLLVAQLNSSDRNPSRAAVPHVRHANNIDALHLLNAVDSISHAAPAHKLAIRQCLKHRQH